jgi:serine/threonine protein kinase
MTESADAVEAIFLAALECATAPERLAFVENACAGAPELLGRARKLLRCHEESRGPLDQPPPGVVGALDLPEVSDGPGTVIGPYKLLEQIGEGGFGVVFMAEQQHPVRRKVALKILKPGMDTRQVVARFEAERQALALMDHPNIAKIHDAGTTASGRPYFVMELVRGVPITEFCDQRRLTPRQRLELFVTVCQAVQHAHQKGIIHRDLKPTNVLVTLHDVVAVPKVIDFGIAKATTQRLTERTLFTHFAQMVGTPLYMSPEQAEMNGLDVDTRSDVYALGVLLYELLTGTTPFESETLKQVGLDEMRRIIREEEPPTPSQRLSTLEAKACSTASERRGADGRGLLQLLQGELDWIVMRALEKDRDRRYESASALAADVQRYLNDEAVEACPPSAGYRLRKYWRRNRHALVTVGIVGLALVAAAAVSTWQADRAWEAQRQAEADRRQAESDRDRARSAEGQAKTEQARAQAAEGRAANEAAIARAVNEFLQVDLLGQVGSAPTIGKFEAKPYLTVKEALDRAAARIGQRFQDQPLVEAAIRTAIGSGYDAVQEWQFAVPHLERALVLRKEHLGPEDPDTLGNMDRLADAYMWVARHPESIALRQQLVEGRKARLGPDHPKTLLYETRLANAYHWAGQLAISLQVLEPLLDKQRALYGETHSDTLGTMLLLAWTYGEMDRFEDALTLFDKFFTHRKAALGPGFRWGWELGWFVQVCQWAGKFDRADGPLREEIAQSRKDKGSFGERNDLANHLGFLAVNLLLQGRYDEAEPFAREAIAINQVRDVKRYYWVSALGAILLGKQKYAEAEPLLLEGYEGMKQDKIADHPAVRRRMAEVAGWIVRLYEATNQPEQARAWREKLKATQPSAAPAAVK